MSQGGVISLKLLLNTSKPYFIILDCKYMYIYIHIHKLGVVGHTATGN